MTAFGNDNHGNKIIIVPFDGARFDAETGIADPEGAGGSGGAGAGGSDGMGGISAGGSVQAGSSGLAGASVGGAVAAGGATAMADNGGSAALGGSGGATVGGGGAEAGAGDGPIGGGLNIGGTTLVDTVPDVAREAGQGGVANSDSPDTTTALNEPVGDELGAAADATITTTSAATPGQTSTGVVESGPTSNSEGCACGLIGSGKKIPAPAIS